MIPPHPPPYTARGVISLKKGELWPVALLLSLAVLMNAVVRCFPALSAAPVLAPVRPVLVIDAGHGGADGGAVAADGTEEAALNLAVALRLEALCALLGVETAMTRRTAALDYPAGAASIREKKVADQKARVELVNALPGAVLLSIHQNFYPGPRPAGAQVLSGAGEGSEAMAAAVETALSALPEAGLRASAPVPEDVYLFKNVRCPAVLAECGFLSNPEDLARLKDAGYQKQLALCFAAAYVGYVGGSRQ